MTRRTLLTPRRWRYRRWNTLATFLLATLVMTAAALGPCFARAVEEATVRHVLTSAPVTESGFTVSASPGIGADSVLPPGDAQRLFRTPIVETEQAAAFPAAGRLYTTRLTSRDSVCEHVRMVAGRCATADATVMASAASARALGLRVGQRIQLDVSGVPAKETLVTLVGLYQRTDPSEAYWFERDYLSSAAGVSVSKGSEGGSGENVADALFGSPFWVSAIAQEAELAVSFGTGRDRPVVNADVLLIPGRVHLSDLSKLIDAVATVQGLIEVGTDSVSTNLPALIEQLRDGFHQAATVERVLTVQLVALALIAFAVIVSAAAGQRGRELALARLRGRTLLGTARQFVGEVAGVVVLAFVPAIAAALGLTTLAGRWWLGPGGNAELLPTVVLAAAAAGVAALVTSVVIGWRVSRLPISELLREIPSFRPVGIGALEAGLATAAAAGLYLSLSGNGDTSNGVSLMMPMLFAALAGLLLGRLLVQLARPVAARAWRRRRCAAGLAAASIGRRRGYRLATVVLCISAALVVFAGQQGSVAAGNRAARAAAENGAAVVLDVSAGSATALLGVVRAADPSGTYATTVALPNTINQSPVMAVDSRSFGAVASWGRADERPSGEQLSLLGATGIGPTVNVNGSALTLRLVDLHRTVVGGTSDPALARPLGPVFLELTFRRAGGGLASATFGPLPASASAITLTSPVDCVDGCQLRGLDVRRDTLDPNQVSLSATFAGLTVTPSGRSVPVGRAAQWSSTTAKQTLDGVEGTTRLQLDDTPAGLRLDTVDAGGTAAAQYLDLPVGLPALDAGAVESSTDQLGYQTEPGLDGSPIRMRVVGHIDFAPRIGAPAILVDLAAAAATVSQLQADTQVWLAADDPGREVTLVKTLAAHGIQVTARDTAAAGRDAYAHAAPALGADLTVAVAVLAALIGLALLLLTVAATWRTRVRDHDALRLLGLTRRAVRRAALLELLTVVIVSVAVGAAVGVAGSRLILPQLPFFAHGPAVPIPVLVSVQWSWAVGLTLGLLALLAVAAVLIARQITATRQSSGIGSVR